METLAYVFSAATLSFVVFSFWWTHWRTGNLRVGELRTYQAVADAAAMILIAPLVFFNDGPTPIIVNNLRLRFLHEPDAAPLAFQATVTLFNYEIESADRIFATPFPVSGREAVLKICEFQRKPPGWEFEAMEYRLALDAKIGIPAKWKQVASFPLVVNEESAKTMKTDLLIRDNPVPDNFVSNQK